MRNKTYDFGNKTMVVGTKKTMVVRTKPKIVGTNLCLWEQNNYVCGNKDLG
jgi:hypothetical protein